MRVRFGCWILASILFTDSWVVAQTSSVDQVESLLTSARALSKEGKHEAALTTAKSVLDLHRKQKGPASKKTAEILNLVGLYSDTIGDQAAAAIYFNESLQVLQSMSESESMLASSVHRNLAFLADERNETSIAIGHFRRTLEIRKQKLGGRHADTASSMVELAVELNSIGQDREAAKLALEAFEIQSELFGEESLQAASVLSELCSIANDLGDYDSATKYGQRALGIKRKLLGEGHPSLAGTLGTLGISYSRIEQFEMAKKHFEQSIAIYRKSNEVGNPRIGLVLIHLGQVYRLQGELKKAREIFREAEEGLRMSYGPDNPSVAVTLYGIAETSFLLQDYPSALAACDKARRITRNHFAKVLPYLPEKEQLTFIDDEDTPRFEEIISASLLLGENETVAELSAAWALNQKGVAQEALAAQNRMFASISDPKQIEKLKELQAARQQIAQLTSVKPDEFDREKMQEQTLILTKRIDGLTRELSIDSSLDHTGSAWIELDDVRKTLPRDSYIIQFARFDQYSFTDESPWGPARYAAWVIPPQGNEKVKMIDLGQAEPIDRLISEIRQEIASSNLKDGAVKRDGEEMATSKILVRLNELRDKIYAPIAPHVRQAKRLVLSPDGSLWLAPWSALPSGDNASFLIEKMSLAFVVSPGELLEKERKSETQGAPVIVANPRFDLTPDGVWKSILDVLRTNAPGDADRERSFKPAAIRTFANVLPLPNTAVEAELISPSLQTYTGKPPVRYVEQYALETIVRMVQQPSVLFFGTHGFFLPDSRSKDKPDVKATDENRNPLARCGLLLAGCKDPNAGNKTAGDDGVLTGLEIVGLNLHGTDMVVLSACETAVGSTRNGEGVASLSQAFHLAGADTVVATLWSIPDRDSALLINKFMEELAKGKSKPDAMQAAQMERIEKRRQRFGAAHPYFWSAFTVNGR